MTAHPPTLGLRQLNRATLARQMLLGREKRPVARTVERLAGLQSQVARPPFVGLWTRIEGFRREDLLRLLRARKIVRVTAMRATLHLMTAPDFVKLRGELQPALTRSLVSALGAHLKDLDPARLDREARAFFGSQPATFDAFRTHYRSLHPGVNERVAAYAVRTNLPLVQVPTDAPWGFPASADFAVADAWLGRPIEAGPAPPQMLVRRYLAAFGPASPSDAQAWSGLTGLREIFASLRPRLAVFRDPRGRELFDLPDAPRPPEETPAPVRFLPEFDNVVLAHDDRSRLVAAEHRPRLVSRNLQVPATFLVDGMVAGTWKVERKKHAASLLLEPFGTLSKGVIAALGEEGEALLEFVEPDATMRDVRVAARPA